MLFSSITTIVSNLLKGQVHFPKQYLGKTLTMEDGQKCTVFRNLTVDSRTDPAASMAVFKVRFQFANLSPGINKKLSMVPAAFLIAMPGFRQKIWTINTETNYFQGLYQWESRESAENYPNSFIFKIMTKRAAPNSLSYEVIPDTILSEYIKTLSGDGN